MELRTFWICQVIGIFQAFIIVNGKPSPNPDGPCVGMDCLHGVLMHNDEKQDGDHKAEDQYLRFKAELETEKPVQGPDDAEKVFHGALMHGDEETGITHDDNKAAALPEVKSEAGPKDLNKVMHESMHGDSENVHKHKWDNGDENVEKGPLAGDKMMHGVMMHGDADHEHDAEAEGKTDVQNKIGPNDAAEEYHGVLMHGDDAPGHEHAEDDDSSEDDSEKQTENGPNSDQLHGVLMHGDSKIGHDHSEDHAKDKEEVFKDISKILEMDLDKDLLKIIDIEKLIKKDEEDYAKWIIENPNFQDESMMGNTMADVSDSILNDIEIMKKRYLSKSNEKIDDDTNSFKDLPFSADDAIAVLDDNTQVHEGEDARHNLELLGNTDPVNARHKHK